MLFRLVRHLPVFDWGARYDRRSFGDDLVAALIVTIMLIPQSLAYALLAGLPPEAGLYASIAPIMLYAALGTSSALAVGPVAIISLMTAATLADVAEKGTAGYAVAALTLAAMSGGLLLLMGFLRLGFIANFLSHSVVAGFIAAAGVLIAAGQLKHVLGVEGGGDNLIVILSGLGAGLGETHGATLVIGSLAVGFLFWVRTGFAPLLMRLGAPRRRASVIAKTGPLLAVAATTLTVASFGLAGEGDGSGVAIVGAVPQSLPPLTLPETSLELISALIGPALLISVIGFVESVSVAQTLAAKRRERIDPDQELIGLGAANLGAAFTGGFPVTGGFARSVVNFDAGAATPAAGAFTAIGLAIAALTLTPLIYFLPKATLAATIIVAVLSLVDFSILRRSWTYSRADFAAVLATIVLTLGVGVEAGVLAGVVLSIGLYLHRTARPHVAEVGLVPQTEHFRNTKRHPVRTDPQLVTLRVDESLYFANARFLEDCVYDRLIGDAEVRHFVLMCSAVNEIDLSALESLEAINERLASMNIRMHLSEVKGPVMDRLARSGFLEHLSGEVFLSQYQAVAQLTPHMLTALASSEIAPAPLNHGDEHVRD